MRHSWLFLILVLGILALLFSDISTDGRPERADPTPPLATHSSPPTTPAPLHTFDPTEESEGGTTEGEAVEPPASTLGSVSGRVVDADGVPLEGIRTSLKRATPIGDTAPGPWSPEGRYTFFGAGADVLTDREGRFSFEELDSANYGLEAEGAGYARVASLYSFLEPGEERTGVEIVLGVGGVLAGVVVDRRSHPIPGAFVTVAELPRRYPRTRTSTDAEGAFILQGLREVAHEVTVAARGYTPAVRTDLEVGDEDAWIVLAPRGTLSVFVTDAHTGAPIQSYFGKLILDTPSARRAREKSSILDLSYGTPVQSVAGEWRAADLESGPYTLSILARGYLPFARNEITIAPEITDEGVRRIDVALDPGSSVRGVLLDGRGGPVAGAEVRFRGELQPSPFTFDEQGRMVYWQEMGISDREGRFELIGLPRGPVDLVVEHPDYRDHPLSVPEGEGGQVHDFGTVTLLPGATVEGTVHLPEGKIVGPREVRLFNSDNPTFAYRSTMIGAQGEFRFSGLDPGRYALEVTLRLVDLPRKATAVAHIELADREVVTRNLTPE